MLRRFVHSLAVCGTAIIAGRQYVVSFDYNPSGTAASFYTEKMQYAIQSHRHTPFRNADRLNATVLSRRNSVLQG